MKKVLVTGITGHLGKAVASKLNKKHHLSVLYRKENSAMQKYDARKIQADLEDKEELRKHKEIFSSLDCVVHLAGHVPKDSSGDDVEKNISGNCLASINLAEMMPEGSHFIFASTCEVYGIPKRIPIDENHPCNPLSCYGASKVAAEKILQVICNKNKIKLTILRFTSIYGPGETIKRAIPNFISSAINGREPEIYGDGSDKRDFLYVDDAASSVLAAVERSEGGTYNVASGESVSIKEVAEMVCNLAGKGAIPVFKEMQKPKIDYVFDVKKMKEELGFIPSISLKEGLARQIGGRKILFVDLDGTLIDVSERLYQLHLDSLQGANSPYTKQEYLELKRKKIPEELIAGFLDDEKKKEYVSQRLARIEEDAYLKYDRLFPGVVSYLQELKKKNHMVLVTKRKTSVEGQLLNLGIRPYFDDILIAKEEKDKVIMNHPLFDKERSTLIGDTEADIDAAKKLGIYSIAVLSGLRDREYLEKLQPDKIVESFGELVL